VRKPSSSRRAIACQHFSWLVYKRDNTYYADGRGNSSQVSRITLGTDDFEEARRNLFELDLQSAIDVGLVKASVSPGAPMGDGIAIADGIELYKQHVNRSRITGGVRPATWRRYRTILERFEQFTADVGITDWSAVTKQTLSLYAKYLEAVPLAPRTQELELCEIKQVHKYLMEEGHLDESMKISFPVRRVRGSSAYCYTHDEFQAIVNWCWARPKLRWLGDVCYLLGTTGMRISELLELRWTNIQGGMIHLVDESFDAAVPREQRRTLKTGRNRVIPIHPSLQPVLDRLRRHSDSYVVHDDRGLRVKSDRVRDVFKRCVQAPLALRFPAQTGQKSFIDGTLHGFRHYFCSTAANSSIPEPVVMAMLGHKKAEMTRRYYHLNESESQRQMNLIRFPAVTDVTSTSEPTRSEERNPTDSNRPATTAAG
jgi:integrase